MTKKLFIPDEKTIKEFYDCLRMEILKPNRLSELEIEKLCKEFLDFVPLGNPHAKIKKGIYIAFSSYLYGLFSEQYNMLVDIVNKYTYLEYHIPYMEKKITRIPVIQYNTDIVLPFRGNIYNHSACGLLNRHFYKKTLNVYALQYEPLKNTIFIVPKPDEIFIKDGITHCLYNTVEYYCDGISVPSWLYKAKKEEMNTQPALNQILYGPPGTGKTYNTIVEAIKILEPGLYQEYSNSKKTKMIIKN